METEPQLGHDLLNEDEIAMRNATSATKEQLQKWIDGLEGLNKTVSVKKIAKNPGWVERNEADLRTYRAELEKRKEQVEK